LTRTANSFAAGCPTVNDQDWRGFSFDSAGQFVPASHYNLVDGGLLMLPADALAVERTMRQAGLVK
jgi:hypothetical protein